MTDTALQVYGIAQNGATANVEAVRAIIHAERRAAACAEYARQLPPVDDLIDDSAGILHARNVPVPTRYESVASVKLGITIIQVLVERIEVAEVEVAIYTFGEGVAVVVPRHGVGIASSEPQSYAAQLAAVNRG